MKGERERAAVALGWEPSEGDPVWVATLHGEPSTRWRSGVVLDASKALFVRVSTAWRPVNVVRRQLLPRYEPSDRERAIKAFGWRPTQGEPVWVYCWLYRHTDGSWRWSTATCAGFNEVLSQVMVSSEELGHRWFIEDWVCPRLVE